MHKAAEVLNLLRPEGGWVVTGDNFEGIEFISCEPITKKQFDDGLKIIDAKIAEKNQAKADAKTALLEKLGITEDEAKLLLS